MLRAEVDSMRRSEADLRDSLRETTERCEDQLSHAASDNQDAVDHLTSMLRENQSQLLAVLTDLDAARRQLEVTAAKLDERSAQLEDALRQLGTARDSTDEMRQGGVELRVEVGRLESERDLMLERLAAYEGNAGVVGSDELIQRTSDLEKRLAEKDGAAIRLESTVGELQEVLKSSECREEALGAETDRLREELESVTADQLRTMAGLNGKVQLFEQVVAQKDRELASLRGELSAGRSTRLSGSCFGKIVAASAEPDDERRLSRLQDVFREVSGAHAEQVATLNKQLEQAGEDLQRFKEHVKKQFESQQEKVSEIKHTQRTHTHTHTHTLLFNGPLSGTTQVSRYQKGKNSLDFTEARDSEWQ